VRTAFHGRFLYAASTRKGVQVVDVARAIQLLEPHLGDPWQELGIRTALNTENRGFGQAAVDQGVCVTNSLPCQDRLTDLAVGDFEVDGSSRPVVLTTGHWALSIVDPHAGERLWTPPEPDSGPLGCGTALSWTSLQCANLARPLRLDEAELAQGEALTLARLSGQDLAIIVGLGRVSAATGWVSVLAVVDVTDPQNPQVRSIAGLPPELGIPQDVSFYDGLAIVAGTSGTAALVSLYDPEEPRVVGTAPGVGGRLALARGGQIFSSAFSPFGNDDAMLGGLRFTSLSAVGDLLSVKTPPSKLKGSTRRTPRTIYLRW
jgi:hypothetical protein